MREVLGAERTWIRHRLTASSGSAQVVSREHVHDAAALPALVCLDGPIVAGLAVFSVRDAQCELVTLHDFTSGRGVASALVRAVTAQARQHRCTRLWLVLANDDLPAVDFYQRCGLRLVAVHRGAIDAARRQLKPSVPLVGRHGIPIHDELELELPLADTTPSDTGPTAAGPRGD